MSNEAFVCRLFTSMQETLIKNKDRYGVSIVASVKEFQLVPESQMAKILTSKQYHYTVMELAAALDTYKSCVDNLITNLGLTPDMIVEMYNRTKTYKNLTGSD